MKLDEILHLLGCPQCHAELVSQGDDLSCVACARRYAIDDGIPILVDSMNVGAGRAANHYIDPVVVEQFYSKRAHTLRRAHYGIEHFPTSGVLVDVGCGPGILTMVAARRGVQAIGLDLSLSMVRFARDKARELNVTNAFFVVGDSQRLPLRSATVDCVVNYANLAHIPNPRRCIADMARIATLNGRVIIQSINHFSLPLLHMKKGQKSLRRRTVNALWRYGSRLGALRDEDCRLATPEELPNRASYDPEIGLDTNDVVSIYIRDLCDSQCNLIHYETFPNYLGWHNTLKPDLSIIRERRSPLLRLKDALCGLCHRIPGLRHMGTDLFLICQPRVTGTVPPAMLAGTEAPR